MSTIDAKIKELQQLKKKIDYISYLSDLIKNDKNPDFSEVKKEIDDQLDPVLLELMGSIENGGKTVVKEAAPVSTELTAAESQALKLMAQAALNRVSQPSRTASTNNNPFGPADPPLPKTAKKQDLNQGDKMNFAISNRHLANKSVAIFNNKQEKIAEGKVVGLDAPNVVIQTSTGTMEVPLTHIQEI